jgi:hypothetical protein
LSAQGRYTRRVPAAKKMQPLQVLCVKICHDFAL